MPLKLPENSREMRDWEWNDYKPYFDYLSQQKIDSNNIEGWMKYWSEGCGSYESSLSITVKLKFIVLFRI